jgi:transposase
MLARLNEGKSATAVALALRVTPRTDTRWLKRLADEGVVRLAGILHDWSTQRLPKVQAETFRQAVKQLQHNRDGGRIREEDIRQLLAGQFAVAYSLNGVYALLKRLDMPWTSARSVSPHAHSVRQTEFKKLRPAGAGRSSPDVLLGQVDIWFQDELCIGQRGTQTRILAGIHRYLQLTIALPLNDGTSS